MSEEKNNQKPSGLKKLFGGAAGQMVLILTATAVIFTAALAAVDGATKAIVIAKAKITLHKGVLSAMGLRASEEDVERAFRDHVEEVVKPRSGLVENKFWKVYKDRVGGELMGYVIRIRGGGFQGIIDMTIGLTPDLEEVIGAEVLETGETPGLGYRITEEWFKKQFKGVKTSPQIEFIKFTKPEKPNQFEAITGATFTSTTVRDLLNRNIPLLRKILKEEGLS